MKPTPFMDAVMTGSPDQVRQESYKQRVANIRALSSRTTTNQKELIEGITQGRRSARHLDGVLGRAGRAKARLLARRIADGRAATGAGVLVCAPVAGPPCRAQPARLPSCP